ncbi:MAG: rRNA maturation RNase YbeY [Parcubacteria group bacterium]|nr:rRNA maturation RNase YbeY [Parcubacteria group bacterium]
MKQANEVAVVALDKRYQKLEEDLKGRAEKILLFLKQNRAAIEIYLVGTLGMKRLNRQYRGRDRATNVLSFEAPKNFPKISPRFLGEVYLCPPCIEKNREDIQLLLAHGILHLLGFNHASVSDRMTMEKMEKKLLTWLSR